MPIYKSSILKYIKSPSTWIPLVVSIGVVLGIGVILPFVLVDLSRPDIATTYQIYSIVSVSTIASSTSLFSATFAAYKSTQIYKSEIEEGTFLVLISKPLSRKRIILEKWLALITILMCYTAIIIIFYEIFVAILDPAKQINNLMMEPISKNIVEIGAILFCIILMITILFSSIALLISAYFPSASTIASVAGLGALIPVSGVLPTFTLTDEYTIVSRNVGSTLVGKSPSEKTSDFLNSIPTLSQNKFNTYSLENLFENLNKSAAKIGDSQDYVNRIALSSNKEDLYSYLCAFDLYYQLNQISSIATDRLWNNIDKYSLINSSNSSFSARPDVTGKKVVVDSNIKINEMIDRINNTIEEQKRVINNLNYLENYYNVFNLIIKSRSIENAIPTINEQTYKNNLILLLLSFWNKTHNSFNNSEFSSFINSPIISSVLNSKEVDPNIKNELNNPKNPYYMELRSLEQTFLFKLLFDLKMSNKLMFSSSTINNYYLQNNLSPFTITNDSIGSYVLDKAGQKYFDELMNSNNQFKELIDNNYKINFNGKEIYNYYSIIDILNLFNLNTSYGISIKSIEFEPYIQSWILILIYSFIAFALVPISYFVIKKQNIR